MIGLVTLWTTVIVLRLAQLQLLQHEQFTQLAQQRQLMTRSIIAPRGIIYDCHMDELATSITVHTVVAEPRRISSLEPVARRLAKILALNPRDLVERMSDPAHQAFVVVRRRIDPKDEPKIEALDTDGVHLVEESMRVYPNSRLASNALGFVNLNGDGGAGLELEYDREVRGTEGQISFDIDARRRSFRGTVEREPIQGHALVLSLDRSIQYIAERELRAGVEKARAAAGVAVVMESDTGRILALANVPDFNGNTYNEYPAETWRNRAVSDMFEPGSTFKVVVASAALEAGLTRPNEVIDCQMGSIMIGGHIFHDHKPYGLLTFPQILENSSNIGAAKLGLRLGEERLYETLRTFGFGAKTGIDLPGEIIGLVRDWHRWSKLSVPAISFGQEVGVTPLQMLVAINSIANGGFRMRPTLVDRVIDSSGQLVRARTQERTRIISTETAGAVREAFEGVVLRGTGKAAQLEGYRSAGKTGTAQKIVDGHYSRSRYVASFIGFAPLPRPRLSVSVLLDEPHGKIYGGEVAAPIFQKIMQEALLQLRVPPDKTLPLPKFNPTIASAEFEDFRPNATPVLPLGGDEALSVRTGTAVLTMPDFSGLAKRNVIARCQELGLAVSASGSGIAVFQDPSAGSPISAGDACVVSFARGGGMASALSRAPVTDAARGVRR